jgi:hypothetical protein
MRFDDAISTLYTEARALVSQCQAHDDRIFMPALRFRNAMRRIFEDRAGGVNIKDLNGFMVDARLDLEQLAKYGVRRKDLFDLIIETGNRHLGWEWSDGEPTLPQTLPAYV